ncbi:MAG: YfiR family protein [Verrucomicrobiales bacterium]
MSWLLQILFRCLDRRMPVAGAIVICALLSSPFTIPAEPMADLPEQRPEYEIKAAFLYKFTAFTQWPSGTFPTKNSPFTIAIIGEDPFGTELDKIAQSETVNGRKIQLVRVEKDGAVPHCQILFISNSERKRVEEILGSIKGKAILTVSDMEPFCSKGGCIRFVRENKKVRLRINPTAAKQAGLRIRSELLAIARIVKTGD